MSGTPLVTIKCMVYNHEKFLRQCLDGFVMQKTTFPFEAIVHDDASTDGSAAIIREYAEKYPDIIKPIYETENQYSKKDGSIHRIIEAAAHPDSKYFAFCEGDDYWTDPDKLQLQVDFLESHPDFSICSHDYIYYYEDTHKFAQKSIREMDKTFDENVGPDGILVYTLADCFRNKWTHLLTCVYRRGNYREEMAGKGYSVIRDFNFCYYVLKHGKGAFINKLMGVYRVHSGGVWSGMSKAEQFRRNANDYFEIYEIEGDRSVLNTTRAATLWMLWELKKEGKKDFMIPELKKYYKRAPLGNFIHLLLNIAKDSTVPKVKRLFRKLLGKG